MKGDFSRSTFDPHKHYTSVRMQQGRVQLDADWNEQAEILLHLIATQLRDLLGPGGTTVTEPGFVITLVEPAQEPADQDLAGQPEEPTAHARTLPDFQIGAGRYYVDGILCENEAPVRFSGQPDYPAAASLVQEPVDHDHFLVYLDVWQRHLTAWEDPTIREIALGGPDTTTRTQTVWQVKLLPLSDDVADDQGWRDHGGLRSLPDWQAFAAQAADKGRLQARWQAADEDQENRLYRLENRLYRVEIHAVTEDQVTFKWSRENGSVVFPIVSGKCLFTWEDVPGKDNDRLLSYLREGLALNWAEGESAQIDKPDDGQTIRIEKDGAWAEIVLDREEQTATLTTSDGKHDVLKIRQENGKRKLYKIVILSVDSGKIECNLGNLELDPYQLSENDWVEIVDDVTVLKGCSLPLCQVKELDRPHGKAILQADEKSIKRIIAEIGERELQHPLLRRWDQKEPNDSKDEEADDSNWENGVIRVEKDTWQALEHNIEVCFTGQGPNQPGDYWLIPARTHLAEGIEWPRQDGQAFAQPPQGITHHYAPLALLQFGEGGWSVIGDEAAAFHSLPHITANLIATDRQLEKIRETVDTMVKQTHVFENFKSEAPLEQGDVVCIDDRAGVEGPTDPGRLLPVKLATSEDGQMVVGVVWEPIDHDSQLYRVAVYGRVRAKVIGEVKPGDLLVPSPVPGHAQRAGLYLQPGTILGKALSITKFEPAVVEEIEEARRPVESGLSQQAGSVDMLVTLG